jgi:3-deoxy-manno-octulosonate cytidylyltransferase (CMP-KDO synthetase)
MKLEPRSGGGRVRQGLRRALCPAPDFVVIIPARHASTRFPGKPLAPIAGRPMIAWVAARAMKSGAAEVIVATDHPAIARAAEACGCAAVMTRADHASGTDRIAEVVARRRFPAGRIVVNVQGDEPLVPPALIRRVARELTLDHDAGIATVCHRVRDRAELENPNIVKVALDARGYAMYFSRAPIPYPRDAYALGMEKLPANFPAYRHVGIYAYRCGFLREFQALAPVPIERFEALEQLRALAHGYLIRVAITRSAPTSGVDTPEDLRRIEQRLARQDRTRSRRR